MAASNSADAGNTAVRSQPAVLWLSDRSGADFQVLYGLNPAICEPLAIGHSPPPFGLVFGVLLDNILFRAVRYSSALPSKGDNGGSPPNDRFTVLLIDTGEAMDISLMDEGDAQRQLFVLPEHHAQIAPQAVACRVSGDEAQQSAMLQLQAYDKVVFKVVRPREPE